MSFLLPKSISISETSLNRTTHQLRQARKLNRQVAGTVTLLLSMVVTATPALSADARSIALGGSAIANGKGAYGAVENPASLMAMKRRGERFHFQIGFSAQVRDSGNLFDTFDDEDNQNLITDIESEIESLEQTQVSCDPVFGSSDDVCVTGTAELGNLSERLLDILDAVDDETLDAQITADFGGARTQGNYPFAVNLRIQATGAGTQSVADGDRVYVEEFETVLSDNELTLGEAADSSFLQVSALGIPLGIVQPEDVLTSDGQASAVLRTQLGISFATTIKVGNVIADVGITPKFSSLVARSVEASIENQLLDDTESLNNQFDDSEVTESSFTFDVGGSVQLSQLPLRLAAVLRNAAPESVSTLSGFEFETTPQLIVGALYRLNNLSVNADIALNEAEVDNFTTQMAALGLEYGLSFLSLRAGISHDASRPDNATAFSVGAGLGPLNIGGRLGNNSDSLELGAQLSFSF